MKIVIGLIIIFFSLSSKGQNNQLEVIIEKSLNSYIEKRKESIKVATIKGNLFFSTNNYPPYFNFKDTIQGIRIKYINLQDNSVYKRLKKGIGVVSLTKVELEGSKLIIIFARFGAKIERKNDIRMKISDSSSFIYEYSCEQQKWLLFKTEHNGI